LLLKNIQSTSKQVNSCACLEHGTTIEHTTFELSGHRRDAVAVSGYPDLRKNGTAPGSHPGAVAIFPGNRSGGITDLVSGPEKPDILKQTILGRRGKAPQSRQGEARQGAADADYLELVDNVSSEAKKADICNWLTATCDRGKGYFIPGECEEGHRFAKELVCGKEWCQICGTNGSIAHGKRFVRWMPKIRQFQNMGYFIFTLPEEIRIKYRTKKALAKLGHDVQELLKAHGFERGLRRYHFFGDKSTAWHPHLNILVDSGFIPDKQLDSIKAGYAAILKVPMADVNYHYRTEPGKMIHTLKYVTRATFHNYKWDEYMALELRQFRNMVVWGRGLWADLDKNPELAAWSMEDRESQKEMEEMDIHAIQCIATGECPVCGSSLVWGDALPLELLKMVDREPLGAGYWRLVDMKPRTSPPADCSPISKEKEDIVSGRLKQYHLEVDIHQALARDIHAILEPRGLRPNRAWTIKRIAKHTAVLAEKYRKKENN